MLHLVIGTMKASKSATLIDFVNDIENINYKIFFPACCNKKDGYVVSRDNDKKVKAIKVFEVNDMYNHLKNIKMVFIDEFQFIANSEEIDEFMQFLEYCDKNNIDVYCFGLSLDYMSLPFDVTQRVLPYAQEIHVLNAYCDECGKPAYRCLRYVDGEIDINPNSNTLLMEDTDVEYKSVCNECYRKITGLNAIK